MYKRFLALVTALALLCAMLTGCGSENQQNTDQPTEAVSEGDAPTETGESAETPESESDTAAEVPALELTDEIRSDPVAYVTDGAIHKDDVVMTVDGTEIKADTFFYMFSYQYYQASSMYSSYGMSLDVTQSADEEGTSVADYMLSLAKQDCQRHVVLQNQSEALGLTLSEEQETQMAGLEDYLSDQVALFYCSTLDAIRWSNRASLLASRISDYYFGEGGTDAPTDETLTDYADENGQYTCRYILLRTDDLGADDAQGKAAQQAKAQELYDQLKDLTGQDLLTKFCELQAEHNADGNTDPFTFDASSSLVDGFREKVAELKPGEVGITDETGYGYFVVLRLDPDLDTVRSTYISERYNALMDEWLSSSTATASEALDSLNAVECLNRMQELQNAVMAELQAQQTEAASEEEAAIEESGSIEAEAETGEAEAETGEAETTETTENP